MKPPFCLFAFALLTAAPLAAVTARRKRRRGTW